MSTLQFQKSGPFLVMGNLLMLFLSVDLHGGDTFFLTRTDGLVVTQIRSIFLLWLIRVTHQAHIVLTVFHQLQKVCPAVRIVTLDCFIFRSASGRYCDVRAQLPLIFQIKLRRHWLVQSCWSLDKPATADS